MDSFFIPFYLTKAGVGVYILGDAYQNNTKVDTAAAIDSQNQAHLTYRSPSGSVYVNNIGGIWQKVNS